MLVVLIGPPGAGKGTQAQRLASALGLVHLSTGEMLRAASQQGTELGQVAADLIDHGQLVPDAVILDVVADRITQPDCASGCLLDGFPRTLAQAQQFDALLARRHQQIDLVLALQADRNELLRRLLNRARQQDRADDTEEIIRRRFVIYDRETAPLLDYYRQRGVLREIDGNGLADAVYDRIQSEIKRHESR